MPLTVASFYRFVAIDDGAPLRVDLLALGRAHGLTGTILLAPEGINATIAGTAEAIATVLATLRADARFGDLEAKLSTAEMQPFARLKVKLKREIITFGVPEANPAVRAGTYVRPRDWNALIADPDTLVLDTRNAYEVALGTFAGAVDPRTRTFSGLPAFVDANLDPARHAKVAMFCTGGIRCEKASAYLLARGFRDVYHLEGGILGYLAAVPPTESRWHGECYVFDGRVALRPGLEAGTHVIRRACGHAVPQAEAGESEPACPQCGPQPPPPK